MFSKTVIKDFSPAVIKAVFSVMPVNSVALFKRMSSSSKVSFRNFSRCYKYSSRRVAQSEGTSKLSRVGKGFLVAHPFQVEKGAWDALYCQT
jgi:hypothetical protein